MEPSGGLLFNRFDFRSDTGRPRARDALSTVASVIHEVTSLLNSRSPFSSQVCAALSRRSVADYGLADFSHFSPLARQDAQCLANIIHDAISAHEPRLLLQDVVVESPRECRDVVHAVISGQILHGGKPMEMVNFKVRVAAAAAVRT
jgi:type VI secretion system lysozyme-like protein